MAVDNYVIHLRVSGATQSATALKQIETRANAARRAMALLRGFLVVTASAAILGGLVRLVDSFTEMENKLKLVTSGGENLATIMRKLTATAKTTRTAIAENVNLFQKLSFASDGTSRSQQELLQVTEAVSIATQISGATAASAAAGLQQLSQAFTSAFLGGDELKSITENLPGIARVIAKEFGIAAGELRAFNEASGGTAFPAQRVMQAFINDLVFLRKELLKVKPTISGAFTVLIDSARLAVGEIEAATGAAESFARWVLAIADNTDAAKIALAGIVGALSGLFVILLSGLISMRASMIVLFPLFTAVAAAVGIMSDQIGVASDGFLTLRDLAFGFGFTIKEAFEDAGDGSRSFARDFQAGLDVLKDSDSVLDQFVVNMIRAATFDISFEEILTNFAVVMDAFRALVLAAFDNFSTIFSTAGKRLARDFMSGLSVLIAPLEALSVDIDKILLSMFGDKLDEMSQNIANIDFENLLSQIIPSRQRRFTVSLIQSAFGSGETMREILTMMALEASDTYGKVIINKFDEDGNLIISAIVDPLETAAKVGAQRFRETFIEEFSKSPVQDFVAQSLLMAGVRAAGRQGESPPSDVFATPGEDTADAATLTKNQITALEKLLKTLFPVRQAHLELEEATALVSEAFAVNAEALKALGLTQDDAAEIARRLQLSLLDSLDPIAALGREMKVETGLVEAANRALVDYTVDLEALDLEQEIQKRTTEILIDLYGDLTTVTKAQTVQVREWVVAQETAILRTEQLTKAIELQQQILESIRGPLKDYEKELEALNVLLKNNAISQGEFNREVRDMRIVVLSSATDVASGFERGFLRAQQAATDFAQHAEDIITAATDGMGDAIEAFVDGAEFDFRALAREIGTMFLKLGAKQLFAGLVGDSAIGNIGTKLLGPGSFLGNLLGGNPFQTSEDSVGTISSGAGFTDAILPASEGPGGLGLGADAGGAALLSGATLLTSGSTLLTSGSTLLTSGSTLFATAVTALSAAAAALISAGAALTAAASALSASAAASGGGDGASSILGALGGGGGGGLLSGLTGFSHGGSFRVGGSGGPDSQFVPLALSPNEEVTVRTLRQQREDVNNRGHSMTFVSNFHGIENFDDFRRSQSRNATRAEGFARRAAQRHANG